MKYYIILAALLICVGCNNKGNKEREVWVIHAEKTDICYVRNYDQDAIKKYLWQTFGLYSKVDGNTLIIDPPLDDKFWTKERIDLVIDMIYANLDPACNIIIRMKTMEEMLTENIERIEEENIKYRNNNGAIERFYGKSSIEFSINRNKRKK